MKNCDKKGNRFPKFPLCKATFLECQEASCSRRTAVDGRRLSYDSRGRLRGATQKNDAYWLSNYFLKYLLSKPSNALPCRASSRAIS